MTVYIWILGQLLSMQSISMRKNIPLNRFILRQISNSQLFNSFIKGISGLHTECNQSVQIKRLITKEDIENFSKLSGDTNPLHLDEKFAKSANFDGRIVHGAFLNSLVSSVIGTILPGPGTLVFKQELNFPAPCYIGEEVTTTVVLKESRKIITVDFNCKTNCEKIVLFGYAKLMSAKRK